MIAAGALCMSDESERQLTSDMKDRYGSIAPVRHPEKLTLGAARCVP